MIRPVDTPRSLASTTEQIATTTRARDAALTEGAAEAALERERKAARAADDDAAERLRAASDARDAAAREVAALEARHGLVALESNSHLNM